MQYESHEYANLFPMMTDKEYQELLESMSKDGYHAHEPILLYNGVILDGRNRYKAAQELNILPMFSQFVGGDEAAYSYAKYSNIARKHWTQDQLAMIGAELMPYEREMAKARQAQGGGNHGNQYTGGVAQTDQTAKSEKKPDRSRDKAAAAVGGGVSGAKVQRAEKLKVSNPDLAQAVKSGAKTLPEAEKEVKAQERTAARIELAEAGAKVEISDRWNVWQADVKTWNAPHQYDFIITDPPYPKEYLPLYETLAIRAAEWLKPSGLLITMAGQSYLDEIYASMVKHLDYYWTACYLTPGQPTPLRQVNVNTTWKPLLVFARKDGHYNGKIFGDVFKSELNDKDFHKWGQSVSGMYDIISKVCLSGQYILDPFTGAGTTGIAALKHGCFFDGIELLEENVNISKARLSE